jgi:hypothetical protein
MGIIGNGLFDGPAPKILDGEPGDCTKGPRPPGRLNAELVGPDMVMLAKLVVKPGIVSTPE